MTQKKHKEKRNPKLNAKKVNANGKKNRRSGSQSFSNNDKKKQSKDNLYQNEEFYATSLEIDKIIYSPTEKSNKDRKKESKKKDAGSNFHLFSNHNKKKENKFNIFQKEKGMKSSKKQIKKGKIKNAEKTGFGWRGLGQRIERNDNNINESSLKTVKKNDHSWAIDSIMEGIEPTNIKNEEKQGFFEKFDFSFSNLLNRGKSIGEEFEYPEFLSTPPFQTNFTSKQETLRKMGSLKTSNFGFLGKNNVSQTKMVQNENKVMVPTEEDFSKIETKESFDSPMVISEMEVKDKVKTSMASKGEKEGKPKWIFTGISGFDDLLEKGIPTGSNIIVAGGPGSGKTIFCLQTLYSKAFEGKDCVFLSMEERPERLKDHLFELGFKFEEIERGDNQIILRVNGKGRLSLKRLQPIRLARSIEALLEKASGTLPVDIDMVLDFIPKDFDACLLTLDSISAIETAFSGTKRQYRIYIEQLFRYFEHLDLTTFMITESSDAPHKFSNNGVEEFLADGIFVLYNFQGAKKRTRGVEIYKLRGVAHSQRIAPMKITNRGIVISSEDDCNFVC